MLLKNKMTDLVPLQFTLDQEKPVLEAKWAGSR